MIRQLKGRCATALAAAVIGIGLALPPTAEGKFMYELRIGEAVAIQGEIAPTLFAGRPCIEVVPRSRGDGGERTDAGFTEVEAGRRYWMMVVFKGDHRPADGPRPALLLRDLDTGASVRTEAEAIFGGRAGAYTDLPIRFPSPGQWSVAILDGRRSFELSSGRVFATGARRAEPADPLALTPLDPTVCSSPPGSRPAPAATSSPGPTVAIGAAVVLIAGAGLVARRRRRAGLA